MTRGTGLFFPSIPPSRRPAEPPAFWWFLVSRLVLEALSLEVWDGLKQPKGVGMAAGGAEPG